MARQFDVFILSGEQLEQPFTDKALGWFCTKKPNGKMAESTAEWVIFASAGVKISRPLLDDLADAAATFTNVDSFAPTVFFENGTASTGAVYDKASGFSELKGETQPKFAAITSEHFGMFSRRILQRTGGFDETLPEAARLADLSLRTLHAGGKTLTLPGIEVASTIAECAPWFAQKGNRTALASILYKALGWGPALNYLARHPGTVPAFQSGLSQLRRKREMVTDSSKLGRDFLKEIGVL